MLLVILPAIPQDTNSINMDGRGISKLLFPGLFGIEMMEWDGEVRW